MSRFEDFVLGVLIMTLVLLFPIPLPRNHTLSNVFEMCINLFSKSISFHCKTHNSPIRIPLFMVIKMPRFLGEGFSSAYVVIFLYSSCVYRCNVFASSLFSLGNVRCQSVCTGRSNSSAAKRKIIFNTMSVSFAVLDLSPLSRSPYRKCCKSLLPMLSASMSPNLGPIW